MRNYDFSVDGTKFWNIQDGSYLKEGDATMSSHKGITEKLAGYFGGSITTGTGNIWPVHR